MDIQRYSIPVYVAVVVGVVVVVVVKSDQGK